MGISLYYSLISTPPSPPHPHTHTQLQKIRTFCWVQYLYLVTKKWKNIVIWSLAKSIPTHNLNPDPKAMKSLEPPTGSERTCTSPFNVILVYVDFHNKFHANLVKPILHRPRAHPGPCTSIITLYILFSNLPSPWIEDSGILICCRIQMNCWRTDHRYPSLWNSVTFTNTKFVSKSTGNWENKGNPYWKRQGLHWLPK